ncbi:Nnf1-domain-containing protein [Syncephalis pseudoplumigaleata]|uniref:Nnf1-domain-containing protein n=1 Tax=Syncephalis pseudoplumigaleata TaxID=1712513 RepID=A0A4P9Z0C9_9FUNG|nr:Nnf1-domain-containing protein [Syncephalis pseudoplumigaleata]|eukprot:RKP24790.1 Nnf1-domain-containing protein [Syncephalis pseudoplumigaleata]
MTDENPFVEQTDATIQLEGDRMSRLRDTVKEALTRALNNCRQLKRNVPNELTEAIQKMRDYMHDKMTEQFDHMVKQRDLVRKLNELDTAIEEAKERQRTGAPSPQIPFQSSTDLLALRTVPVMKQELQRLETSIAQTQEENDQLLGDYQEKRERIQQHMQRLQSNIESLTSQQLETMDHPVLSEMLEQR